MLTTAPEILRSFLPIQFFLFLNKGYVYVQSVFESVWNCHLYLTKSYNTLGTGLSIVIKGFNLLLNTYTIPTSRYKKMNVKELTSYH